MLYQCFCHRLHVVKSALCQYHASCLAKLIFLTVDTVNVTLNKCNVVQYVSSTHNVCKVFPSTHNSVSTARQVYCPENNIANSHLPLINSVSSETKFSASSLTSNLNVSEYTFSVPEISCSRIYHVSSSVKFSLFFILFNEMLLHQPMQNRLMFNIFRDFTLFLFSLFEIVL